MAVDIQAKKGNPCYCRILYLNFETIKWDVPCMLKAWSAPGLKHRIVAYSYPCMLIFCFRAIWYDLPVTRSLAKTLRLVLVELIYGMLFGASNPVLDD